MHILAQQIVAEIARENSFTIEQMVSGGGRKRIVSYARFEAMARIRGLVGEDGKHLFSLPMIGRWFNTDHTTVHHAAGRYQQAVAALVEYRRMNPTGDIPCGALKRSGIEQGLATYIKVLAVREDRERKRREPEPEPDPTPDEKHVAAILAQRAEGFEAHREVYRKQTRFGIHRTLLPRTYHPLVDPDDIAWYQGLVLAA
jgi:hypothetical protein